jgi:hypothetical protein
MGSADGRVIGLTKIVDAGPPGSRWNLVIVADGYRAPELGAFAEDARAVSNRLFATAPFNQADIREAINVYRLDVESTQSGADKPICGGSGGGRGTAVATYFDGRFCFDGKTQRLLYGDDRLVRSTVEMHLAQWHQILVLVNDSERGGGGGAVGWLSNGGTDWQDVAIHEMGHSAFGLADEYDYNDGDRWPGGEPAEPNVTAEPDPTRVKWRALVTAGPAIPTRRNPNCSHTDPGPSPVSAGTVGTFEGARYYRCGSYRPVWNCKMRQTLADFCPVCQAEIIRVLGPFLQP